MLQVCQPPRIVHSLPSNRTLPSGLWNRRQRRPQKVSKGDRCLESKVPYTLAENAGMQPVEIVTQLRAAHANGEKFAGINVKTLGKSVSPMHSESHYYSKTVARSRCLAFGAL